MTMKIEEESMVNKKQGIVTILSCESDTNLTASSLRRTLSADMSSKKWIPQNESINPIKKIASSQQLFQLSDDYKETKIADEAEAERERLEIWSSIQRNKNEEQQKGGSFDTWSSLMSLKTNDEISKSLPPYIHPLAKRTKSSLSRKSLEICTESLGSETGSDGLVSSNSASESGDAEEDQQQPQEEVKKVKEDEDEEEEEVVEVVRYNYSSVATTKKLHSPPRSFPPPLPSLSRQDGPSLHMRPHRDNGRLVLEAVSLPSLNNFCVRRQDGRLVLTFANQNEDVENEKENDGVGELDEEFEGFGEEKEDEDKYEDEDEDEDEENGEYESLIEKVTLMSCCKTTIKRSVDGIGSYNNNKVNKPIGLVNRNPKWSKKLNNDEEVDNNNFEEENVQVVEASQMVKSLPPRPRVARLIPSPQGVAPNSFNLNSYQHYWRTTNPTTTTTKGANYPLGHYQENNIINNNNNNKIVVSPREMNMNMNMNHVSNEKQQLLVLRGKNGDYLVHNLKSCKDSRRSFLFWEPYCIATS
ncbi:protein FAF-like, chloroplastic [Cicer arietinum]|uniref:Protein FAF-like, chloroplastic n=1 Tax=Cicer arietinum TaxID=3827 RepID=A0A1S2YKN7_CICAR|nr:protein FAF-like, chloroplastic [Cicer arietinum]